MRSTCKKENKSEHIMCTIHPLEKTIFYEKCRKELKQSPCAVLRRLIENFNKNTNRQDI